jgi:putative transposase
MTMPYDPNIHHRRSIRLPQYDYAQPGAYFVTICTHERECVLGDIADGRMELNDLGDIAQGFWLQVPVRFPSVIIDACVTMPNHGHAIIVITDAGRGVVSPPDPPHPGTGIRRGVVATPDPAHPDADIRRGVVATPDPAHPATGIRRGVVATPATTPTPARYPTDPWQGGETPPLRPLTLGEIVAFYKYQTTKTINQIRDMVGTRFWQRNYWEHVIRNEAEMQRIREYIQANPARWRDDQLHPAAPRNRFNQE